MASSIFRIRRTAYNVLFQEFNIFVHLACFVLNSAFPSTSLSKRSYLHNFKGFAMSTSRVKYRFPQTEQGKSNQGSVLQELRTFLSAATNAGKVRSPEVARSAIFLLKMLPAAREGVFEHLYNFFDEATNNYVLKLELEDNSTVANNVSADESIIEEVRNIIIDFIKGNPEAWAPLISKWALNLLGYLSNKYSDRRVVPHSSSLPDILQLWMGCCPTRTLIDLTTQSLLNLIGTNPDMCINVLLETSVKYSPHFDWVVAHIGSCFPTTIITRVLACGLKDFSSSPQDDPSGSLDSHENRAPKMASAVGILGHLASQHGEEIRRALVTLFQESLVPNPTREQLATVPFLLHLATMSDMLLNVITSETTHLLTPRILNCLSQQTLAWRTQHVPGTEGLVRILVHLLLRSHKSGLVILQQLLSIAMSRNSTDLHPSVPEGAGIVLDHLLLEVQRLVHTNKLDVKLLQCLKEHALDLCAYIKKDFSSESSFVLTLLSYVCLQGGENTSVTVLGKLLCIIEGPQELADFLRLLRYVQLSQPSVLQTTVASKMAEMKSGCIENPVRLVDNLGRLAQLERHQCLPIFKPNLDSLAAQLTSPDLKLAGSVVHLLSHCLTPERMSMSSLFHASSAVVAYFLRFICTHQAASQAGQAEITPLSSLHSCYHLVSILSERPAIQQVLLRMLVEGVLHPQYAAYFGSLVKVQRSQSLRQGTYVSLLDENRRHATSVTVPQSHSSVFHAGVIGNGLRSQWKGSLVSPEGTFWSSQALVQMLLACCHPRDPSSPPDQPSEPGPMVGSKVLALLLVELVSPDVIFNGLPWPDEDFNKVTIERDLIITKTFEEHPVLWDILMAVATVHPSLCYCSVLLRALMAVSLSHWSSCQDKCASNTPKQLEVVLKLLNVMAVGQLLPPPLDNVADILSFLTPFEVYCLLSDIWLYFRDHVPAPELFMLDVESRKMIRKFEPNLDPKYTNRLNIILQANVHKLGKFYGLFFQASV